MISNFLLHEKEFNKLLNMIKHDKGLFRVDDDWTDPKNLNSIGITNTRIEEYRKIFNELAIPRGFSRNIDFLFVEFISTTQGLAVSGSSKSYIWLKDPPNKLVDNIDNYKPENPDSYRVYRHIKENWYLFYEAD